MAAPAQQQQQQQQGEEGVVPGRRARDARRAIQTASQKVVERITLEAMEQSFPDFTEAQEDRDFIRLLTQKTAEHLQAGFEEAWTDVFTKSDLKEFTARANISDQMDAAASQRRDRGEPPLDAWKQGKNPELVMAASVIPKLQIHLDNVKQAKVELEAQSNARLKRVVSSQSEIDALEGEIRTVLMSIQEGSTNLQAIDADSLREMSDGLLPYLGADKL